MEDVYVRYLTSHSQERLATVGPDGGPQNKPVGYRYNAKLGTIDIGGYGATVHGYDELHAIHERLKKEQRGGPASRYELVRAVVPAPGVVVAQIRRTALGADSEPVEPSAGLTGPFSEMALYVLVRRGGTWWLAAGQNTPVLPPPRPA